MKLEEKGGLEDDLNFSYQDKDEGDCDFANFPCHVEGNFENCGKRCFPQSVRRKKGSNLNRPGSNHRIVASVKRCVDDRRQTPLVFVSTKKMPRRPGEEGKVFHYLINNSYRYVRRKVRPI